MGQRGKDRRQAMIAAALELVGERGPNAVTLGDVGERVGTSHAAVLYHFRSRRELLLAVLEERDRRARTVLDRCFAPGGLRALRKLSEVTGAIQREPNFTKLAFVLSAESLGDDRIGHYFQARHQYIRGGLARAMRIGQEQGEIRTDLDVDARAAQVAAFLDGIAMQHFIDPAAIDIAAIADDYVQRLVADLAV
jgi:AcrR family transcriptional regulator